MDILMIDYSNDGFKRYAESISKELHSLSPNLEIGACYMHNNQSIKYSEFSEIIDASKYKYDAEEILKNYKPKLIITFAHRFCDYMFTVKAHKLGILVANFQHGIYMPNTVVSSVSKASFKTIIRKKRSNIKIYSSCIRKTGDSLREFVSFLKALLTERSIYSAENSVFGKACNADVSYVYGSYWEDYYKKQYNEYNSNYIIVGYPELEGETEMPDEDCFSNSSLPSICYLAQSSVEDGIIDQEVMMDFYSKLISCLGKYNLILKLHPRSNPVFYSCFLNNSSGNVTVWDKKTFPIADIYIGHDSAVVARAMYLTEKTLVYRLLENRVGEFEKYALYTAGVSDNLITILQRMMNDNSEFNYEKLESYAYLNKRGSIKQTAEDLLNQLKIERTTKNENSSTDTY